ncbi:hypothetical protein BRC75_10640 [Halobacteriales archaeon QH_7_69_31]|nr:MAG: hypothetical protein BRC75_10640 [Halobacteriales archaeon QH_7_69_31]
MDAHAVVDKWQTATVDDGLEEAARMARRGESGAVRSGTDWLFIADGDPVAVVADLTGNPSVGDVDALEGSGGEALEAPHEGVARLVPMLALGGEVRGEYFSDDTPVGTVQETLEDGGFTGYVELSENVLSGDYYAVFEEGRAEYVAFVGSTEQLFTGAEAEEKTNHEVGIYSVVAVDLPDVRLPEPEVGGAAGGAATGAGTGTGSSADADADREVGTGSDPETDVGSGSGLETGLDTLESDSGLDTLETGLDTETDAGSSSDLETGLDTLDTDDGEADTGRDVAPGADSEVPSSRAGPTDDPVTGGEAGPRADTTLTDDLETSGSPAGGAGTASPDGIAGLRRELREVRSTLERLEGRVATLEAGGDGAGPPAGRSDGPSLSPAEALSKTTLFVREGTRGGPTLEDAHEGRADRDAVADNVGLERHTRFEAAGATVDGEPYESFLESSQAYEFVEWLTTDLLFEVRVTDSEAEMARVYDAIPAVDRVFFEEAVTFEAGGETVELRFDVVVRDRNGAPLFVARLDDRRDPTPGDEVGTLVTDASDFCAAAESVVGAFGVTASYFEPAALEVAREATTSSLLSREKYRSYVNLARNNGFHLCLVEAREAAFHLAIPDL